MTCHIIWLCLQTDLQCAQTRPTRPFAVIDLDQIRLKLEKERHDLIHRNHVPVETVRGDEADLAALSQYKERELWLENDARQRLASIEKALERIAHHTYGLCANCGKPIPEERLSALPLTLYDVACQSKLEKKPRR